MLEENMFFLPVRDSCRRNLITCEETETVTDAARIMRDHGVSSLVVRDGGGDAVGIVTDRDLRNQVVAVGRDPRRIRVAEIMRAPLVTVGEDDTVFEALYRMSHHRIHRVAVVDEQGRVVGLIGESDVIRLQRRSPQQLLRAMDQAQSVADLKSIHTDTERLIVFLCRAGVRTRDLMRLIAVLNDHLSTRLIALLQRDRFPRLPAGCAFLVLGSEGRREQTLKTDQDNAIIYADDLAADEVEQIEAFSQVLIEALIEIGVPECPGGIMARNDFWRRSLSAWAETIDGWVAAPSGENILNFSMFSDMRTVWGDVRLERQLRAHIVRQARQDALFLARMAANVCRFEPPLGLFGAIKTEKRGDHAGAIDLKKAGIFTLGEGVKALALEIGILGGNTLDKISELEQRGVLPAKQARDVAAAFNLLSFFRLRGQVEAVAGGAEADNFVSPAALNRVEKARLLSTLQVVGSFADTLRTHFQTQLLLG